jgi:chromosome partitioning protein
MKTIAIFNVKGGVGKTTTATSIAHLMATEFDKKVLLVDLDPQSNTTSLLGENKNDVVTIIKSVFLDDDVSALRAYEHTVGDLLLNASLDARKVIVPTDYKGLDLLPAFLDLAEIEEKLKADIKLPQQFRLKNHLDKIASDYDYCILDLSPSINVININGLAMTDFVLTPLRCDMWGIAGYCIARNLINTVASYNPKLDIAGCFFVQWTASNVANQIRDLMRSVMGDKYIDIPIRKCVRVEEMTYEHKALGDHAGKSTAAEDYRKLTRYLLNKF